MYEMDFWSKESDAPILNENRGFLVKGRDNSDLKKKLARWLRDAGVTAAFVKETDKEYQQFLKTYDSSKPERIFVRDAERAYRDATHQQVQIRVLTFLQEQFGGYHQGE